MCSDQSLTGFGRSDMIGHQSGYASVIYLVICEITSSKVCTSCSYSQLIYHINGNVNQVVGDQDYLTKLG